jgi:hypothetical protein
VRFFLAYFLACYLQSNQRLRNVGTILANQSWFMLGTTLASKYFTVAVPPLARFLPRRPLGTNPARIRPVELWHNCCNRVDWHSYCYYASGAYLSHQIHFAVKA